MSWSSEADGCLRRLVAILALAGVVLAAPAVEAKARKPRVVWSSITVRDGRDQEALRAMVKSILEKEGRRANWGKRRDVPVEAMVEVRELSSEVDGDVVHVHCMAIGKIPGVGVAKSKFSYGGKPSERSKLEKHVLALVARGIVTRLSEMARAQQGGWSVTKAR